MIHGRDDLKARNCNFFAGIGKTAMFIKIIMVFGKRIILNLPTSKVRFRVVFSVTSFWYSRPIHF